MTGPQRAIASQQRDPRLRGTPVGEPVPVRVWLLGGFRVTVGPRSIREEEWRLKKAASLLKLLALAPGHRLHREQAMELLWPDLDADAALNNLHHVLHVARRTLEPTAPAGSAASRYLHLRDEWLALCPEGPLWVDVEAFEEAAATARHALVEPAAYRAAMDVYAGELLPEDCYEPWVEGRREELSGAYLSLLMELAGLYEERGELEAAIEALGRAVAEGPVHQESHVRLMRLYILSGRRREALRQYERLRETLFRELGAVPGQQPPPHERAQRLTRREQEIALLVGRGLTNRRIAQELSISERTVHSHLRNILKKLGFRSRTQIAAWVAER
jgi:DNA-binding SARP family transcriptional activator